MIVNKIIYQGGIILQHLTYYFKNRLYLHAVVHSSYRTIAICFCEDSLFGFYKWLLFRHSCDVYD